MIVYEYEREVRVSDFERIRKMTDKPTQAPESRNERTRSRGS